jgi:hypothetical protein
LESILEKNLEGNSRGKEKLGTGCAEEDDHAQTGRREISREREKVGPSEVVALD